MAASDIVIGIDLGTTNTCAACYRNDRGNDHVKILENAEGGRITPSFIYATEKNKIVVGTYAQKMTEARPQYGISEIKRLIGRRFDDPYVQNNLKYFSFEVVNKNNNPEILIKRDEDTFTCTPETLSTVILTKIKADATSKLGVEINKAVITVPAYFNVNQREATLSAAKNAGFTVLKLLNEPTAAALKYYQDNKNASNYSLIYDLGGGTFDVAILQRTANNIDIVGVDGDTHLGGHDFDNLIVDYVCRHLEQKYKFSTKTSAELTSMDSRRIMRRIRNNCEEAKKTLSIAEETLIVLNGIVPNVPTVEIELTRSTFEDMANILFQRTINIVNDCLKNCNINKNEIKEVILSGGSTRIPKIQQMVSNYFDGKSLNKTINPDECVAEGAALQAAMLSKSKDQQIEMFKITDVTPLSLGISNFVDLMTFVIKRNTPIPVTQTLTRVTIENQQRTMSFDVYEGERMNAKKNYYLATISINDITPAPPGQCEATFTMSIDENGILKVKASEKLKNNFKDLTIVYTRGHRSDKEVQSVVMDAEKNKQEDEVFVKFAYLKEYVLDYCERARYNFEQKNLTKAFEILYDFCKTTKEQAEPLDQKDTTELRELRDRLVIKCENVVKKYNFELMPVLRG